MTSATPSSRVLTAIVAGTGLLAVALFASRSAANESALPPDGVAEARQGELATLVAEKQAAAQKAIATAKRLTGSGSNAAVEEGEAVVASAKISAAGGELLKPAAKPAAGKARTIRMVVTAYCPCKKCCGKNAQGITASGKPVSHNSGRFVAADTTVLPFGKKLVIPGYHQQAPVQVLDTGSAIKGNRLDVYFPSHQKALEWGKRVLDVTVVD